MLWRRNGYTTFVWWITTRKSSSSMWEGKELMPVLLVFSVVVVIKLSMMLLVVLLPLPLLLLVVLELVALLLIKLSLMDRAVNVDSGVFLKIIFAVCGGGGVGEIVVVNGAIAIIDNVVEGGCCC